MRLSTFIRSGCYGILVVSISFGGFAQNNPFDSKKHKDTVLNKSGLKATTINGQVSGKSLLMAQPFGNFQNLISPAFAFSQTKNLQHSTPDVVVLSKESGLPIFISTPTNTNSARTEFKVDLKYACFEYLKSLRSITKIEDPAQDFEIKDIYRDEIGNTHVKLFQKYKGVKIFASEVFVHLNESNVAKTFNGNYHFIGKNLDVTPLISPRQAVNNVIADVSTRTTFKELSQEEKTLLNYTEPVLDTVIYENRSRLRNYLLAYHVAICPNLFECWEYFVDAKTGSIINHYKKTCHIDGPRTATAIDLNGVSRQINTYQVGFNYYLIDATKPMFNLTGSKLPDDPKGAIVTLDLNNSYGSNLSFSYIYSLSNIWNNSAAVSAHYNAGIAYNYFRNVHGRNSIDGNGGTIVSFINTVGQNSTESDYGKSLDNAFWSGKAMFYGNGNYSFTPLAGSLDVAGHEMTHGVIQNSANLKYEGESGAINESMADIFGCLMDSTDWLIGEDIVKKTAYPSGALRSLSDPHNGGGSQNDIGYQPRHINEKYNPSLPYTAENDYGGVHINSGIPNWAFYKYATALNSRHRASKVFYRALTNYLTSSSQFIDLRIAVIQSAKDLYGNTSNEVTQAGLAFDAVGITDGSGGVYTSTLPTNTGTEYLLSYNTDESNPNGLYRSSPTATNFDALITKSVSNKPSVTDDGETCVFVGTDNKLYAINLNPSQTLNLTTVQNEAIWSSVAISKDGKRIAGITYDKDTSIYVYDFGKAKWARFKLYNPTFAQGVKSNGPVYADAIEWTYDGESLVYDCFNSIPNSMGKNIEYWDINTIKVWDNILNDYATGDIVKLINNLDEGESIGNPVFSKNSPYIMAFDYINDNTKTYGIVGLDMEKNDLKAIASNNTIGWPTFNKTDTRIAFTTLDGTDNYDINYVTLNTDKISSNSVQTKLVDDAKWPVYYTNGVRSLAVGIPASETAIEVPSINVFPNPTTGEISIMLSPQHIGSTLEVYNQLGLRVLSQKAHERLTIFDLTNLTKGIYSVVVKGNGHLDHFKVVKQ